ncbi:MAG: 2-succinyl-5-enolpyruvyl-6-hydroxy-3-cyclohexene-1-carboxylic-acid synthase [Cyclobacteriaceae bacterium]|nr:2-succinyl-5-enolpyruvyl-6-hydroxy-3-cyclohexene-1-carboxylic-acid synthase [Cyclobacteriaceae bacterium]
MVIQPIVDIPVICAAHGIRQAVICPGSRSALITIAFARHPEIATLVIPDERSAGFIALGLAQSSKRTVAVICTSGTAAANLYPAVIEAFYQEVPLLIITADRPPELIGQQDGQTIRQHNLFANHIRGFYQFPASFGTKQEIAHATRLVNEAILNASGTVKGPAHLNVPVREPFYPAPDEKLSFSHALKIIEVTHPSAGFSTEYLDVLIREFASHERIMIFVGQQAFDVALMQALEKIREQTHCVVVGEIFSNIHASGEFITNHDVVLTAQKTSSELRPDLLITCGGSIISKNLKYFLRENPPSAHWHIGENPEVVDTYQTLTQKMLMNPAVFFESIADHLKPDNKAKSDYQQRWQMRSDAARKQVDEYLAECQQGEFAAISRIMKKLPHASTLHLANSMPVRYAGYVGLKENVAVWANRGTSGIDGCTSTAVGHALNTPNLHVLITGDMAFFYDRNGLWHQYLPPNLRIVVLNNHGGGIFRLIDGPGKLPELNIYFETQQTLKAENSARDFGMAYYFVNDLSQLDEHLLKFFDPDNGASILEIETNPSDNEAIFTQFKQRIKQLWKN